MLKKLFTLFLAVGILTGCENASSVTENAAALKASVATTIAEVQTGVSNVVGKAQGAYETLLEKKAELETTVGEINEAVAAANKLLGKEDAETAQVEKLHATIAELQSTLAAAEVALKEVDATEKNLQNKTVATQN
jgi:uncharacterized coiled-coil DUF342 family protein